MNRRDSKSPPVTNIYREISGLVQKRKGPLALGLILISINRAAGLVLPGSTQFILDDVVVGRRADLLFPIAAVVGASIVVQAITSYSLFRVISIPAQRLIADLRIQVQQHIGRLPLRFFDGNKTGSLVSRVMADVEGVSNLIGTGLVDFLGGILTAVFALVMMLRIHSGLTLLALSAVSIFAIVVRTLLQKMRGMYRERSRIRADVTGRLTESFGGIRVVKGFHAQDREAEVFSRGVHTLFEHTLKVLGAQAKTGFMSSMFTGLVAVGGLLIGSQVLLNGAMSIGEFSAFTLYMRMAISPVFQVVGIGHQFSEALAGLDRVHELLREQPEDEDPQRVRAIDEIQGHVRFEDVSFEYDAGRPVLHQVTFEAVPGSVTALVGPSGSGKSTLIGLVAAFTKPTLGRVLVDSVDLSTATLQSYRSQLGVVLQENFLFDGTIRENILFGRPTASPEEVLHAARVARVDEFAERLEKQYETVIGERGVKLSGGQRQRLSIARAILASPRILILDEATSSLDPKNEVYVQQGLAALMRGRTTFAIAHRLTTIRNADQILLLVDGRIKERGTHEELMGLHGSYYEICAKQAEGNTNLFVNADEDSEDVNEKADLLG